MPTIYSVKQAGSPNSFQEDAFGRIKTSSSGNRADVEFIYNAQPLLMDDISAGAGSVTHDSDSRDVQLAIGGTDPAAHSDVIGKAVVSLGSGTADIITVAAVRYGATDAAVKSVLHWKEIQ